MGVLGLRKYLEKHNVTQLVRKPTQNVDHLALDMNGLLHTAYNKTTPTEAATLCNLRDLLDKIINFFLPRLSLIVAFDGPAPLSKLGTQRERRRSMLSNPGTIELNEAQIVTGSFFVKRAENFVLDYFTEKIQGDATFSLVHMYFSGCTVRGEGESKIMARLLQLAADATYNPDHSVVIVGNDSDLTLNCIACTPFHNLFVVHPYTFIVTAIGDLLLHWLYSHQGEGQAGTVGLLKLPTLRTDFVFVFLLAGGDYYPGLEDSIQSLWYQYRRLRGEVGVSTLIGPKYNVNIQLLEQMLVARKAPQHRPYSGPPARRKTQKHTRANQGGATVAHEPGLRLIQGALWAFRTICEGHCPDFQYTFQGQDPTPGSVLSAIRKAPGGLKFMCNSSLNSPLLPLQVYVAVIPNLKMMPPTVANAMTSNPSLGKIAKHTSTATIVDAILSLFQAIDPASFTTEEKELLQFGRPFVLRKGAAPEIVDESELKSSLNFSYPEEVEALHFISLFSDSVRCASFPARNRSGLPRSSEERSEAVEK